MGDQPRQTDQTAMIIVTDQGFAPDDLPEAFSAGHYGEVTSDQLGGIARQDGHTIGLSLDVNDDVEAIAPHLGAVDIIKVPFGSFADGRGFSLGLQLRRAGFKGRLRAVGHVIVDQYAHARRCGFDEVAISAVQAARQPEDHWLAEVPKIDATYQLRLHQADRAA